jgi:diguanylate cyclase (GGDEF)-like protein
MIETEPHQRSVESHLPLVFSASGAIGVLPFMVLRYMRGEWTAAIIDTVIVAGLLALSLYVYKTRRVGFASFAIACICSFGIISTVYFIGPNQIYWAYPAVMAIFYLVRPKIAFSFVAITIAALVPVLIQHFDPHISMTIIITMIVMGSFAFGFSLISNRQRRLLVQMATKDPLTGAGNRRHLDSKLRDVVNAHKRTGTAASMLILDLDHFKKVNDVHGHRVGDQILVRITEIVNLRIRVTDSLYRIGGEEFVVVLEGLDLDRAGHLAEQLRTLVQANELVPDQSVTISLGVAELRSDETENDWMHRADEALYRAKRAGRNATMLAE